MKKKNEIKNFKECPVIDHYELFGNEYRLMLMMNDLNEDDTYVLQTNKKNWFRS